MPVDRLYQAVRLRTDANIDLPRRIRRKRSIWRSLSRDTRDEVLQTIAQRHVPAPNVAAHHLYCQRFELSVSCVTPPQPARARHDHATRWVGTTCVHARYRPGGLPTAPSEYSERSESVVALVVHCRRRRVVAAARLCSPRSRGIRQRFNLFARRLQRELGLTLLRFPLRQRVVCHAVPRHGASLRAR
jgi:hypothetical protein